MGYNCKDLNWKYRWTQNSVSLVWHKSSEIWLCLPLRLIYCHFPTGPLQCHHPDLECSCLWAFAKALSSKWEVSSSGTWPTFTSLSGALSEEYLPCLSSCLTWILLPSCSPLSVCFLHQNHYSDCDCLLPMLLVGRNWTSLIFMFLALTHSWPPNTIG